MPPPRRRSRIRKFAKWTGVALGLLIGIAWLVSLRWNVSYYEHLNHQLDSHAMAVRLQGGTLLILCNDLAARHANVNGTIIWGDGTPTRVGSETAHDTVVVLGDEGFVIKPAAPRAGWRPDLHTAKHFWQLDVPLWLLLAAVALPTAFLFWRDRPHYGPHQCQRCGYDLTGNTTGRCPECGTATNIASTEA